MVKSTIASIKQHPLVTTALLAPFLILIFLNSVNPLLREKEQASYCPTPPPPTPLEQGFGVFPSPVTAVWGYVVFILVLYAIGFIVYRVRHATQAAHIKSQEVGYEAVIGPSVTRILAPFLLASLCIVVIGFVLGFLDMSRQPTHFSSLINTVLNSVNTFIIPFTLLLIFVQLLWGAFLYLIPGLDGNKLARRKGRIYMSFSFFIFILIILFWGVINLMATSTGLQNDTISMSPSVAVPSSPTAAVPESTLGFAVGGAKDIDNFRENIEQCYLPIPTDITHEGLFFDYVFETANQTGCTDLFCPQYEAAVVPDPFSGEDEYFLSVGLGSNIDADTFERMPLDVVVVLDISGSMKSPFDRYYYDSCRDKSLIPQDADWNTSKMEVAKEALGAMVDRLKPEDRLSIVTFDNRASTLTTVEPMGENGYATAKNAIYTLQPRGGTNMGAGLEEGTRAIKSFSQEEGVDRERRIIFLTDAMPNTGAIERNDLYRIGQRNAEEGIHATFIGVGVDFNTELIQALTKEIKGANYFAIHSSTDFEKRLDIEFEYMVFPLVFDLNLTIESGDYEIRAVYGSPESDLATGEILKVSTLFPTPTAEGNSRGGVILAHMKKIRNTGEPTRVTASYMDRTGATSSNSGLVNWQSVRTETASPNVRKAVLLSRYANLIQNWTIDENLRLGRPEKTIYLPVSPYRFYESGLAIPYNRYPEPTNQAYIPRELNHWERLSRDLVVSEDYRQLFGDFQKYMEQESLVVSESEAIQDEIQLLENLTNSPDSGYKTEEEKEGVDTIIRDRS